MSRSEEPNGTFRLQNNTVYELQYIQLSTTFKHKHGGNTNKNACDSTKLKMNYKWSFNKAVTRHFYKISFRGFENKRNHKIIICGTFFFVCVYVEGLLRTRYVHRNDRAHNFSSPVTLLCEQEQSLKAYDKNRYNLYF